MIYDKLSNIRFYSNLIDDDILKFISSIAKEVKEGKVHISDRAYANIETYKTKLPKDAKFESHEKYIDIQILLSGEEDIFYTSKSDLSVEIPYNFEKDITFYSENVEPYNKVTLDGTNFVVLYPHEAHAPQVCSGENSSKVKKVVVKIKI